MNHLPQAPDYNIRVVSNFFQKLSEVFTSQGAPQVSIAPVATYFRRFDTSMNDTGRKFATDVSDCLHIVNLKKNCIYLWTLLPKSVQTKHL